MSTTPILDGYTILCLVPSRGPWPDVRFTYRPMLAPEVCEFLDNRKSGTQRLKMICKRLAAHIVSWDVRKPGSSDETDTVPVTEDNLAKMPMSYLDEMMNAVLSYSTLEQVADVKN